MSNRSESRESRRCTICGRRLIGDYYYYGRCREHQTTTDSDTKITAAAVVAKRRGLSYGQYMAIKNEEVQSCDNGEGNRAEAQENG